MNIKQNTKQKQTSAKADSLYWAARHVTRISWLHVCMPRKVRQPDNNDSGYGLDGEWRGTNLKVPFLKKS